MKNYVAAILTLIATPLCSNNAPTQNRQLINNTLTMLLTEPYSYRIKSEVIVPHKGTLYTFSDKNASKSLGMDQNTPAHYAAQTGDVGDLKTLASWGANLMSTNRFGETPLMHAVQGGNFRAAYYLIQHGAQPNKSTRPFEDFNPFHYAVLLPKNEFGTPTVIKTLQALLLADPGRIYLNQRSQRGTPLEIAVKEQLDPHIIRFLIMQGAKVTDNVKKGLKMKLYKPIAKAMQEGILRSQMYTIN